LGGSADSVGLRGFLEDADLVQKADDDVDHLRRERLDLVQTDRARDVGRPFLQLNGVSAKPARRGREAAAGFPHRSGDWFLREQPQNATATVFVPDFAGEDDPRIIGNGKAPRKRTHVHLAAKTPPVLNVYRSGFLEQLALVGRVMPLRNSRGSSRDRIGYSYPIFVCRQLVAHTLGEEADHNILCRP